MNFKIGDLITGYDEEGLPCKGRISGFAGEDHQGPKARICLEIKTNEGKKLYSTILLNTAHKLPIFEATHTKESFLAAANRCSPVLYFKDDKSRRDYLDGLWEELARFGRK